MNLKVKTKAKHVSSQPRKQRKALYTAPLHKQQKTMHAHVAKELRAKLKTRSMQIRKGDKVKIMRGKFAKTTGKVLNVNLKRQFITVEGALLKKQGGKETFVKIQPSKVLILEAVDRK